VGTLQHAHSTSTSTKTFVQPDPSEQTLCRDRSSLASRRCKGDLPTLTAAAAAPTGVDGTRMRSGFATDQDRCRAPRTRRRTAAIRSATAVAGNKYAASPDRYMHQPFSRSHSHTPGPVQSCVGHIGQSCSTRASARTVANSQVARSPVASASTQFVLSTATNDQRCPHGDLGICAGQRHLPLKVNGTHQCRLTSSGSARRRGRSCSSPSPPGGRGP
jgi:hypothetical protein